MERYTDTIQLQFIIFSLFHSGNKRQQKQHAHIFERKRKKLILIEKLKHTSNLPTSWLSVSLQQKHIFQYSIQYRDMFYVFQSVIFSNWHINLGLIILLCFYLLLSTIFTDTPENNSAAIKRCRESNTSETKDGGKISAKKRILL